MHPLQGDKNVCSADLHLRDGRFYVRSHVQVTLVSQSHHSQNAFNSQFTCIGAAQAFFIVTCVSDGRDLQTGFQHADLIM